MRKPILVIEYTPNNHIDHEVTLKKIEKIRKYLESDYYVLWFQTGRDFMIYTISENEVINYKNIEFEFFKRKKENNGKKKKKKRN